MLARENTPGTIEWVVKCVGHFSIHSINRNHLSRQSGLQQRPHFNRHFFALFFTAFFLKPLPLGK